MQHFTQITHLFFDLDDTLWDFTSNSQLALQRLYHENGLDEWFTGFSDYYELYAPMNHHLWKLLGDGEITKSYLSHERFAYPLRCVGGEQAMDIDKMSSDFLTYTSQQTGLVPGAIELLESLKGRYRLGILSNGFPEVQYTKLRLSGLASYFDIVVLSEEIGAMKPDRAIYDAALQRAGCDIDEVMMIGDNWDTDIEGALKAGWKSIFLNRSEKCKKRSTESVFCVTSLKEISEIIS